MFLVGRSLRGRLAEGLRFDRGQYGSFAVFAAAYLQFPAAVLCGCGTAA